MQVDSFCTCGSEVIDVKSLRNNWRYKNRVSNISGTEGVKKPSLKVISLAVSA